MSRIKPFFLLLLLTLVATVGSAQTVTVSKAALVTVPETAREKLPIRLLLYLRAFNSGNMSDLFHLVSSRAKRGMTKDEFIRQAKVDAQSERILKFQIQSVQQADKSDYIDEPEPGPGEGVKWFISGCARVSVEGSKPRNLEQSFDVWLVDCEWYVRRGGLRIDGGYRECKFK
ncbi:MAG: hypothetical protein ACT4O9_06550 [Blastocatellia bacterium]